MLSVDSIGSHRYKYSFSETGWSACLEKVLTNKLGSTTPFLVFLQAGLNLSLNNKKRKFRTFDAGRWAHHLEVDKRK